MYKLIAIDVDDTLITDEKRITEGTIEAIRQAVDRGVVVTLATGRMYHSAKAIAALIGLDVPLITYQGSLVKTALDELTLYERTVPQNIARRLFEFAAEHGLYIQGYHNDKLLAREACDKLFDYCALSDVPYTLEPDLTRLSGLQHTKIIMIDEPDVLDKLLPAFQSEFGGKVHMTKSKPHFLEFVHPEGTKGHALKYVASHFGCSLSEVIAVGDSWNDMEMLEAAGLGVAMDNSVEPLKRIADYVTKSNNDEGVRHVIEKFLLQ